MNLPRNYQKTTAAGERIPDLPEGGYVCIIRKAAIEPAGGNAGDKFAIYFDVHEGGHKGYYARRFEHDKQFGQARWRGKYDTFILDQEGNTNPRFKGLITSIEESNPNAVIIQGDTLHEERLTNCLVGVLIGSDEWSYNGRTGWSTRPRSVVSVKRIHDGNFETPKPRPLKDKPTPPTPQQQGFDDVSTKIPDDDLPF